jgi:hypothetical protein
MAFEKVIEICRQLSEELAPLAEQAQKADEDDFVTELCAFSGAVVAFAGYLRAMSADEFFDLAVSSATTKIHEGDGVTIYEGALPESVFVASEAK